MAIPLTNQGSYDFIDISSEEYRTYEWADGTQKRIKADWLCVTKSGHRLLDRNGISWFIPFGWITLRWKADPHFVK